jgi:inner membrane protein
MDSLTHILTGVAIGQVFSGENDRFKPLVWGAIAGNIPDLDVVFQPFISPESSMLFHRGFSHSLLLWALCSPLLALTVSKLCRGDGHCYFKWLKIISAAWFSHLFLDIFNTYGTGIFEPFSSARISYDAVNVYDLLLSVPLLITSTVFVFIIRKYNIKRMIALLSLMFSLCYISFSIAAKIMVESKARIQLAEKNIYPNRLISSPLPLSNLAWKIIAESHDSFYTGVYYGFWKDKAEFDYLPKYKDEAEFFEKYDNFRKLKRFTKGWCLLDRTEKGDFVLYDLRFSSLKHDENALCFPLHITDNSLEIGRTYLNRHIAFKNIKEHCRRLKSDCRSENDN